MKKLLILIVGMLFLFSCQKQEDLGNVTESNKPIYTSFYPIYFLTKSLVGDEANVINLVPAGGEPHDYEPTLRQIGEIKNSDVIVLNGLGIESYEEKLLESIGTGKIILLSEDLKNLIEIDEEKIENNKEANDLHNHGNIDPHTWLSPKTYLEMSKILAGELEKKGFKNLDKSIINKLEILDKKYSDNLKDCKQKEIVTSHEAFGYLARDYNFTQYAVFGISPEEEPSAKDIVSVINLIKEKKLNYVFSEEFISTKFSETIKNETGVNVLTLHPLETLSSDNEKSGENYITIMEKNLESLKVGLECK